MWNQLGKLKTRALGIHERTLCRQAHGKHERVTGQWSAHKCNRMHCCAEGLALQCLSFTLRSIYELFICKVMACFWDSFWHPLLITFITYYYYYWFLPFYFWFCWWLIDLIDADFLITNMLETQLCNLLTSTRYTIPTFMFLLLALGEPIHIGA